MTIISRFSLAVMLAGVPLLPAAEALAQEPVFDEARFGVTASVQPGSLHETGAFLSKTLFFDPLGNAMATGYDKLLHPRLHVGTTISTSGETSQVYAGFDWQYYLSNSLFLDAGIGGTIHNGDLKDDGTPGPKLGSRVMFHEFIAVGVDIDEHWRLLATADHSSNGKLADPNDGVTYAGFAIGYKF